MNYAFAIPWFSVGLIVSITCTRLFIRMMGPQEQWPNEDAIMYLMFAFSFFLFWIMGVVILGLAILGLIGRGLFKALA